jgi:hypothetical protein
MNQIMVNAVEFDSLLKEVEYLKHENQKLKEQLKDTQDRIRSTQRGSWVCRARVYKTMSEEVTVNDIAALLEVSRKSAIQRMARLVKKNQAIKLNMPTVGNPARFKLLVSKESLLHTQKFAGPKMNRQVDWKKFCSDPFRHDKEGGDGMNELRTTHTHGRTYRDWSDL